MLNPRLLSMFPTGGMPPTVANPTGVPFGAGQNIDNPDQYDPIARMRQLYNPNTKMEDQFTSQINNMPQRGNFNPSVMRQIAGVLANIGSGGPAGMYGGNPVGYRSNIPGGIAAQEHINDAPFDNAMQDWRQKLVPLQQAADNERGDNTNSRIAANSIIVGEQRDRSLKRLEDRDSTLARQKDEDIAIRQKRADAYVFKTTHPNLKSFTDKDGMLVFVDPSDPTKIVPTHLDTGKWSDMEKAQFDLQGDLEKIHATGAENRSTKEVVPGKNTTPVEKPVVPPKPLLPSQEATARINRIITAVNANPKLADYFEMGTNGKPTGKTKQPGWFTNDEGLAKQAVDIANGSGANDTGDVRSRAIAELQKRGKAVNEETIKMAIQKLGGK